MGANIHCRALFGFFCSPGRDHDVSTDLMLMVETMFALDLQAAKMTLIKALISHYMSSGSKVCTMMLKMVMMMMKMVTMMHHR